MSIFGTLVLYNITYKAEKGGEQMKIRPEYRAKVLRFAKKEGFETTYFCGMYKDFEVYTAGHKVPCVIGLPQVIFANEKTIRFNDSRDPFKILDACKKLPKVVFEYDCICFFGSSYKLFLFEDGRLIREDYDFDRLSLEDRIPGDFDFEIIKNPALAKEIKQLIKENKEELRSLSKDVSNPSICDGASETFRFGRMKFEGSNILTVSMEGYKERFKENNYPVMGWEEDLLHFQRLFKKFQNKFHEYVVEPLFNGEEIEDDEEEE